MPTNQCNAMYSDYDVSLDIIFTLPQEFAAMLTQGMCV